MKIEIDEYEFTAIRKLYGFSSDEKALKCDGDCDDCYFRILENMEGKEFFVEPHSFCVVDLVRAMIRRIDNRNN